MNKEVDKLRICLNCNKPFQISDLFYTRELVEHKKIVKHCSHKCAMAYSQKKYYLKNKKKLIKQNYKNRKINLKVLNILRKNYFELYNNIRKEVIKELK